MFKKQEMAEYLAPYMGKAVSTLMRQTAQVLWDLVDHYTNPCVVGSPEA